MEHIRRQTSLPLSKAAQKHNFGCTRSSPEEVSRFQSDVAVCRGSTLLQVVGLLSVVVCART